jgi:hypothetical protein
MTAVNENDDGLKAGLNGKPLNSKSLVNLRRLLLIISSLTLPDLATYILCVKVYFNSTFLTL